MKLTTAVTSFALLAAALTTASAQPYSETNAQRMQRGLGPNRPVRRNPTGVAGVSSILPIKIRHRCLTFFHIRRAPYQPIIHPWAVQHWLYSVLSVFSLSFPSELHAYFAI